jgi:hypothetical protein
MERIKKRIREEYDGFRTGNKECEEKIIEKIAS